MNLFDQNFSAKTLKAFSKNSEWTTIFARDALDALATHELSFVMERVFDVCNRTNSVDAVVAFFAVVPNISHVVVEGDLVNAWEEKMRADPNLRMPMYNYDGPGSKTTLGHLYPLRWLALTTDVKNVFSSKLKEFTETAGSVELARSWVDEVIGLGLITHPLESVRYNGPYSIL